MLEQTLQDFIQYCKKHIKGDEKGEAQVFLDRFFMALGYAEGVKGAGATLEDRIKSKDKRSTRFADLVWKPRVLIEMKKRGEKLAVHYQQAFQYWVDLVPDRPQYVILCNFDEFWIYDFNVKVYDPVDKIKLEDLVQRNASFSFLLPRPKKPVFDADREDITASAAEKIASVFISFTGRRIAREEALRYALQCVIAMFAEDAGLLPNQIFTRLIQTCSEKENNSYDLIGGLFQEMNRKGITPAGLYEGVDYFNGGLFEQIIPILLTANEINLLDFAARRNWRNVNPAIFGSIFQSGLEKGERHILGAHYTSEIDIKKIVLPCIVQPWQERIDQAETLAQHFDLLKQLCQFTVLDPACGSGNFLFVAFKEMKLLEAQILDRIRNRFTKPAEGKQFTDFLLTYPYVNTSQFYGYDIKPFAVELAKVTLMVAKELSFLEYQESFDNKYKPLPLDNLDANILCIDALLDEKGNARAWHKVDVIIGNPPFQSKNKMQQEFGVAYMNQLRKAYPEVSGMADFCVYWFYKAHQTLKPNAYAGLVGTNTITQNNSRESSLDYITQNGGTIFNAVASQDWAGEAVVFVSIVNWTKGDYALAKILYMADAKGAIKPYSVAHIHSSLSLSVDVSLAKVLACNTTPKTVFQGQTHGHEGFLLTASEAKTLLKKDKKYAEVLKPFLIADELIGAINSQPKRFVIDFTCKNVMEAAMYKDVYHIIQKQVLPEREAKAQAQEAENQKLLKTNPKAKVNRHHIGFYNNWWKLSYGREDMLNIVNQVKKFIACAQVSKRPIFEFVSSQIRPNAALIVFPFEDDYSFGIIQSVYHWEWWKAKCSTLKGDFRYTADTVWDTFPFPQSPTIKQVKAVAEAALTLRQARNAVMQKNKMSFRDLYRLLEQPGKNPIKDLHFALDEAVRAAYSFAKGSDVLTELLVLNQSVADREAQGLVVQAPGLPSVVSNPQEFVSKDCVEFV